MHYIITNIAYGTGPYLRVTELCIAFNDELERRGKERMPFIVPLVYGERQKNVMLEEFAHYDLAHPGHILLDARLGELLSSVFYANSTYEEALGKWSASAPHIEQEIRTYLSGELHVETLAGDTRVIQGSDIALEMNRSPRVSFGIQPSYSTSFGYISDILEAARGEGRKHIDVDPELLTKGAGQAVSVEGAQTLTAMAYPATFSWQSEYADRFNARLVPPITNLPKEHTEPMDEGIFVTITGIPGLERLYREAAELGLRLYSNDTKAVVGSIHAIPHVITNPAIKLQFARSGWGSVWLSMFCGTPIVVPEFDPKDDPEIFFNNRAIERTGIGIVYRGQSLSDILQEVPRVQEASARMRDEIVRRFGTLDGNEVCAKMFVDHFIKINN